MTGGLQFSNVCSVHFSEECFEGLSQRKLGFKVKLTLKPDVIPNDILEFLKSGSSTAFDKRERARVSTPACLLSPVSIIVITCQVGDEIYCISDTADSCIGSTVDDSHEVSIISHR